MHFVYVDMNQTQLILKIKEKKSFAEIQIHEIPYRTENTHPYSFA